MTGPAPRRRPMPGKRPAAIRPAQAGWAPAGTQARRAHHERAISGPAVGAAPSARHSAGEVVRGAAGLVQVMATSSLRLTGWSLGASVAGARYVARRAVRGESAAAIIQDAAHDLRATAWRALGVIAPPDSRPTTDRASRSMTAAELRRRGTELMRLSNDVHFTEDTHPAYARILSEIAPDEARILRLLYLEGPQPAIDIRTNRPLGIGSQLVAGGLTMIAEHAGCRNADGISRYLTNLRRLGLITFSTEQVINPQRYQVLEAQPKVTEAMKRGGRLPRTVHRSVHLNEFGVAFCEACLPVGDVSVADLTQDGRVSGRWNGDRPASR